jgi:hypothetical protein
MASTTAVASEIKIPEEWSTEMPEQAEPTDPKRPTDAKPKSMGTSPDGKKSAMLSEFTFSPEELKVTPDKLARAAWNAKEAEKENNFTIKSERRANTSLGEVVILTSEGQEGTEEKLETYVIIDGTKALVLRLLTKGEDLNPGKDPELMGVLRSWKIKEETNTSRLDR